MLPRRMPSALDLCLFYPPLDGRRATRFTVGLIGRLGACGKARSMGLESHVGSVGSIALGLVPVLLLCWLCECLVRLDNLI